ncbi:MAG: hypothetical protein HDT44_07995 [Ruminococcaceae bacterium]|nr:hypothetical protein [Oscillospiraceae bacterium]
MKKRVLKAIISTITAVSFLQVGVSAKTIGGWSTRGEHGQVYTQLDISTYDGARKPNLDSVTATAKITIPAGTQADSYLLAANITYLFERDYELNSLDSPSYIAVERTNTDSKTVTKSNSASLTVKAGSEKATTASASVYMKLNGYGSWTAGSSVNF